MSIRFLLLLASLSACADWQEFRGPNGRGQVEGSIATTWSETENISWKVAIPGLGWSSPVTRDGRIYLSTAVEEDRDGDAGHSLRLLCLDAEQGKTQWNVEVFWQTDGDHVQIHKKNSHASATPVLAGDRLYVHFGPHGTACLDLAGKVQWRNHSLRYEPTHGNGGSPALSGDTVIIACDGQDEQFVVGLNAGTGKQVWRQEREAEVSRGFSFCTPTIIRHKGQVQAISPGSGAVVSYAPKTGKKLWSVGYGEGYSVVPRPQFVHGLIYVCTGFNKAHLLAIDPAGAIKWRTDKAVPKSPTPIIVGDALYMVSDNGIATCLDAHTGEEHWVERLQGKYSSSPIAANGHIYFLNESGTTIVIKANARKYSEVARNTIEARERSFATLTPVDGALLLRSETDLYRIE
jgi:outer membrane protein assembly factor BamB